MTIHLKFCASALALAIALPVAAQTQPLEIHQRLQAQAAAPKRVALTLDACSGRFDEELITFLIDQRIPATLFVTKRWLDRNPQGTALIKDHLDLLDVENHGEKHIPAVIGAEREVYGLPGHADLAHLRREVREGARAIEQTLGVAPRWYRGATGIYDAQAVSEIERLGYGVAGFSVNADDGATLKKSRIEVRLKKVKDGDVIIAHMNKPASDTAEGLMPALIRLQQQGFVFVRLDQVALESIPGKKK